MNITREKSVMKYPRANNFLIYKKLDSDTYEIENYLLEETWVMKAEFVRFLRKLNGHRNPYSINPDMDEDFVDELLSQFEEEGLLRVYGRAVVIGFGCVLCTLWIPKIRKIHYYVAKLLNRLLLLLTFPVFIVGVFVFANSLYGDIFADYWFVNEYLLIGFGLILHELAHAAACIAYGGKVFEFGIRLYYFLPGAYVCLEDKRVKNRLKKAQIDAAGIEMNLFLSGLFMCLSCFGCFNSSLMFDASIWNFLLAFLNSLPFGGFDGINIFSELLGVDKLLKKSKYLIRSREKKRELRRSGIQGYFVLAVSYFVVIFQGLFPVIWIFDVLYLVIHFLLS